MNECARVLVCTSRVPKLLILANAFIHTYMPHHLRRRTYDGLVLFCSCFFSRMMVFRVSTVRCSSRSSLCSEDLCIIGNICMVPSLVRSVIKAMQEWLLSERIATFDFSALCTTSATLVGPSMYYIVLSALRICWRYEKQKVGGKTPLKESISRSTSAIQHHFSLCLSTKNPGLLSIEVKYAWGCSLPTTVSWS